VLAPTGGSLSEVVGDAAGKLNSEDIDEIVTTLTRLTTDVEWRTDLRAVGLAHAQSLRLE